MRVTFNGSPLDTEATRLIDLVPQLQPGLAVAVNDEVVPRRDLRTHRLAEGDRIELVTAVAGG